MRKNGIHDLNLDDQGKPKDKGYLERDLPEYLQRSLAQWVRAQNLLKQGEHYTMMDCDWCELNSDINVAEVENEISTEQANYLREKYLGMEVTEK